MAQGYASLAVLRFITGVGLGGEWAAGMVLFNEVCNRKRRGLGSAFVQGSAVLSTAAASVVGTWAIAGFGDDWGWRVALLTGGAPLVLAVAVRVFIPESAMWLEFDRRRRGPVADERAARDQRFPRPAASGPSPDLPHRPGVDGQLHVFLLQHRHVQPTLMLQVMKTPPQAVRSVFLLASVVGGVSFIGMGWLNDRFGRRFGAMVPALVWLGSAGALALYGHVVYAGSLVAWPFLWLYLAVAVGNTSAGVIGPWLAELFPTELRATGSSAVYMIGRAVGSLAPLTVPIFASWTGSLLSGMLRATPGALLFLLISLPMRETAGREIGAVENAPSAGGHALPAKMGVLMGTRP
jgi:MFS family permease